MAEQKDSAASKGDAADKEPGEQIAGIDANRFKTGVAVGIGSAAIVAALMYARSGKAKKK